MDVIRYLHQADLLLEDEQSLAIIGGGHYVLSVGDKVFLKTKIDDAVQPRYLVDISFASNNHGAFYQDEWLLKFEGCREKLQDYLHKTTVH